MGAPSSPTLANIVASRLDRRLDALAKKEGVRYTRYADDLTFSFKNQTAMRSIPLIKEIIADEGFVLNRGKEEINYRHQRQYVTGLVVNEELNIKKENYKRLRATLHNTRVKGINIAMAQWGADNERSFKSQLEGHINFLAMINESKARKLREDFLKIRWNV